MFNIASIKQAYPGHSRQVEMVASQCHAGAYLGKFVVVMDEGNASVQGFSEHSKCLLIAIPHRNCLTHLVKQSACKGRDANLEAFKSKHSLDKFKMQEGRELFAHRGNPIFFNN
jgi:hypothetical protein